MVAELEAAKVGQQVRFEGVVSNLAEATSPSTGEPCVAWHTTVVMESFTLRDSIVERPRKRPRPDSGTATDTFMTKVQTKLPFSQQVYADRRGPDVFSFLVGEVEVRLPLSAWSPKSFYEESLKQAPSFVSSDKLPQPEGREQTGFRVREARLTASTRYLVMGKVAAVEPHVLTLESADVLLGSQQDPAQAELEKARPFRELATRQLWLGLCCAGLAVMLLPLAFRRRALLPVGASGRAANQEHTEGEGDQAK